MLGLRSAELFARSGFTAGFFAFVLAAVALALAAAAVLPFDCWLLPAGAGAVLVLPFPLPFFCLAMVGFTRVFAFAKICLLCTDRLKRGLLVLADAESILLLLLAR